MAAAAALGIARGTIQGRLAAASRYGLNGFNPVPEGFEVSQISHGPNGDFVKMRPEGPSLAPPEGLVLKGASVLSRDGREVVRWDKYSLDETQRQEAWQAFIDGLRDDIPTCGPVAGPDHSDANLLTTYNVTDYHLSMLSWAEETGSDWDIKIAEDLLIKWFRYAIDRAPPSKYALFAQMGDFLHYDSMDTVTPAHRNVLDADSRPQKVVRVAIRVMRAIVKMILEKHEQLKVIICDANHDPMSSIWQREFWAMHYEELGLDRVTVDTSADTYYAHEFGKVSLFYHHGHKRTIKDIDHVFAAKFREMFGRTEFSYGNTGHLHSYKAEESTLMTLEQHPTLAPEDAYASRAGWMHKRNAKVLTFHKDFGEVYRSIITPAMVYSGV